MGDLSCFLSQNAIAVENAKVVASKRFLDENQNPVEWEIQCITPEQDDQIKKGCTTRKLVSGKKGVFIPETDYDQYVGRLAVACTVFPNLNDKELQDSYQVMGAEALLKKMLIPGEYRDYLSKVQEVNGFDVSLEELVETAKN
jgi:hypothetical protein